VWGGENVVTKNSQQNQVFNFTFEKSKHLDSFSIGKEIYFAKKKFLISFMMHLVLYLLSDIPYYF